MAHVPLTPIGRARTEALDERAFTEQRDKLEALEAR